MKEILLRVALLLCSLPLVVYAFYCVYHLAQHIGTDYWTNEWFYKSHACLVAMAIIWVTKSFLLPNRKENQ